MKAKLLTLFSLLALLLVSTAILADGRPTGIRIGRAVSGGGTNVEIDVTVTGTDITFYPPPSSLVYLGNGWSNLNGPDQVSFAQYANPGTTAIPFPPAIDWGDGSTVRRAALFGPPAGPWRGTFSHSYVVPSSYVVSVGKSACCSTGPGLLGGVTAYTGNIITGNYAYNFFYNPAASPTFYAYTQVYSNGAFALTANTTVTTGAGIPTMNIYGLLALSLVLVGTGVLLYRKPQRTVA